MECPHPAKDRPMTITIPAEGFNAGLTISSGDPLVVLSGGVVEFITILDGASATLSLGAVADGVTVYKGGVLKGAGELIGDSVVYGAVNDVALGVGGYLSILSGGVASALSLSGSDTIDSQFLVNSGGKALRTMIESYAEEVVYAGGVASGDIVESGGLLYVAGGTVSDETVQSGGSLVYGGDLSSNLIVSSGAISNKVVIGGVTVDSGGALSLLGATVLQGATVSLTAKAAGIELTVSKGGTLLGPGVLVDDNVDEGVIRSAMVQLGSLVISSGGVASALTVSNEGEIEIDAAGSAKATVLSSGGAMYVYKGGAATGDSVLSASQEIVSSGGTVTGTTVGNAGTEIVSSGGTASGTKVLEDGLQYIYSGGVADGATVSAGGRSYILSGGTAVGLSLLSGGDLNDDGELRFAGAGSLDGSLGGTGTIVQTETGDLVLSGSEAGFDGSAVISGGTIELAKAGALGTGYVRFVEPATGSAVLQIDAADAPKAGGTFVNTISNFSGAHEDIDLRSIAFVSGATAKLTGSILALTDGGKTYKFKLAGSMAGAYPVTSDGHGGTLIDPTVARFAQTAAAFAPSDAAITAPLSAGGTSGFAEMLHAANSAGGRT